MAIDGVEKGKKVVVIGGGIAGGTIAKALQPHADVILIDPKEYLEIPWARLRSMVEPSFAERTLIKHSEYLPDATVITSHATNITAHEVLTADGQAFSYDYLVIATGHPGSNELSRKDRLQQFHKDYAKIKSSNSILIVGGGPTGVELAGEIAVDFPEKRVTIVHKGQRLLEFIGPKASKKTLNWLVSKKVEVILGQSVDWESLSEAQSLDKKGLLTVDENLRVKGHDNIFAIGDITDVPELKQGFLAQKHASVVAKNLTLLIKGTPVKKLATYTASPPIALVSLGRKEGVAQLPFGTISGCLPGKIKSKDLFVGKTRKGLGLSSQLA
ncbi:hypothetical protein HPP92_027658 [Vanilla planifolia]|uniref:FAD/NAD(P)-binding domain-containing protein n=1 Tax=Vanilla planifolia TaxID=51239 RepID=A0A835PAX2_VANPL|nr:hypothetical protein HPP92_027658 [Vanilla planifolia]